MVLKTYNIEVFSDGYIPAQLDHEIFNSGAVSNFEGLIEESGFINILGTSMNEIALDTVINSHVPDYTTIYIKNTVRQNKEFADDMMQRMKEKNISEGLSSIDQSAWVHHRLRKTDYTLSDNTTVVQIDVMNLVVSGDIETAEHVLGQMSPDDMTESYHWLTQERIDWIRNEIRQYLGWALI